MPTQQPPAFANYLLPQSATSIIPQQLGNDYLSNLEQTLNQSEQQQMNQLLGQENMRGTVSSGDTNFGLAQIAGNTQNQFANAATGLSNQAARQAQQQGFNTQFETQAFQNQLAQLAQQASYSQQLQALQASLGLGPFAFQPNLPSFGSTFGQSFAGNLPNLLLGSNGQPGLAQNAFTNGYGYFNQQPQAFAGGNQFGGGAGLNLSPFGAYAPGAYSAAFQGLAGGF